MPEGYIAMAQDEWKPPQEYEHGKLKVRFSFKYLPAEQRGIFHFGSFTQAAEDHSLGIISRDNPGRNEFQRFRWEQGPIRTTDDLLRARTDMGRAETYGESWFYILCTATLYFGTTEIVKAARDFESDSNIEYIKEVQAELVDDLLHREDAKDLLETLSEQVAHVQEYLKLLDRGALSKQLKSVVAYELLGLSVGA